jgi:threonine dehydrogenase-like Zn-dependent dehydrogenase
MGADDLAVSEIWVSEHYWPGVVAELVTAQAQRLARADGAVATVVLPGEQTAFGLHVAHGSQDVHRALAVVGLGTASVAAAWLLRPRGRAADVRLPG